jgi:two-component system sensor histidine kinase HydH
MFAYTQGVMARDSAFDSSPPQGFSLTKQFALLSFVCIGILAVALWFIAAHYLTKEMLDHEWGTTAQYIRTETKHVVSLQDFQTHDFAAVANKFAELHRQITMMPDIARIKVYNARGVIIWSDEHRLIGTRFANNDELADALAGKVVADISHAEKEENVFERGLSRRLVEVYVPIFSENDKDISGVIETYKSADALFHNINRARFAILIVAIGGSVLLYLSLFAIVNQAAKKIDEQQNNLLNIQSDLSASQRMAAVGEMAAAVAHGIGNPLSSIRAVAQVAKLECSDQQVSEQNAKTQQQLDSIIQEVDRVQKRMRGLLNFARPLEPRLAPVQLNHLLQEAVASLRRRFEEAGLIPTLDLDLTLPTVLLDPAHLEQIVQALLTNAIEATPQGGRVTIRTKAVSPQEVCVTVEDTGEGIPSENRERVFVPFFTTKPQGTGIGLPLTKKFVERNGGKITIADEAHEGTRIEVTFPLNSTS